VEAPRGTVLLVEDEDSIGRLVKSYLEQRDGWQVEWVRTGEDALMRAASGSIRIVLLDLGLPGIDGFEVCRRLRSRSTVPIVMLTARDEEADRVAGLEIGADDYISKPFSPRELAARIKAILRRSDGGRHEDVVEVGPIVLRRGAREVTVGGDRVDLTQKEFDLLACLLENRGLVLSRERLLELVWGLAYPGGTRTVDVHVAQLRRKLKPLDPIQTMRGTGYKLVDV